MIIRLSCFLQIVHEKYSLGGYTQFLGYTVRPLQRLSLLSVELEEVAKGQLPEILIVTGFTSMAVDAVAGLLASEREKEYADCCREYAHELLEFSSANRKIRVSFYLALIVAFSWNFLCDQLPYMLFVPLHRSPDKKNWVLIGLRGSGGSCEVLYASAISPRLLLKCS